MQAAQRSSGGQKGAGVQTPDAEACPTPVGLRVSEHFMDSQSWSDDESRKHLPDV